MSRYQNAGRSQDIKVYTSTFERVEVFVQGWAMKREESKGRLGSL
jgi:hypothetical protein